MQGSISIKPLALISANLSAILNTLWFLLIHLLPF